MQLAQLLLRDLGWRAHQQVAGLLVHGEQGDLVHGLAARQRHDDALDAGRQVAHDVVYGACRAALDKGSTLLAELERNGEVTKHLDKARLAELTDPAGYLGSTQAMIDRALSAR